MIDAKSDEEHETLHAEFGSLLSRDRAGCPDAQEGVTTCGWIWEIRKDGSYSANEFRYD